MLPDAPFDVCMLAERWRVTPHMVRAMIRRGELRCFKLGGKLIRIPRDAVLELEQRAARAIVETEREPTHQELLDRWQMEQEERRRKAERDMAIRLVRTSNKR
jgi:excisionase family DNA binding protein